MRKGPRSLRARLMGGKPIGTRRPVLAVSDTAAVLTPRSTERAGVIRRGKRNAFPLPGILPYSEREETYAGQD